MRVGWIICSARLLLQQRVTGHSTHFLADYPPLSSCSTLHLRFHLQPCRHLKPHLGGGSSDLTRFCAFTACPAAAAGGGCCPDRPRGNRGWGAVSIGGRGCNTGIGFRLLEYESQTTQCNPSPRGGWWLLRKRDSSHDGRGAG